MFSSIYSKWNEMTHRFESKLFLCGELMRKKYKDLGESKMGLREFFELLWVNTITLWRNTIEFFKVAFRYYGNTAFFKTDMALRLMYLFHNPFSISKRFLKKKGEQDIYAYGETPLTSLEKIAKEAQIGVKDVVFELGSGRGRNCFWLNSMLGCSVVGIEYIPEFVERANLIKNKFNFEDIEFRLDDMIETDYAGGTVFYLYGTCLDDSTINKLIKKFSKLPSGTKIITVSYSLQEYTDANWFEVMKHFTIPFTWGSADVFIHVIK